MKIDIKKNNFLIIIFIILEYPSREKPIDK